MFGIIRPCRHRLTPGLHADWVAHLCGLCLTLRDEHGQFARTVTNYDGLVISALVEAQSSDASTRRNAGPCPFRAMRRASVAQGSGARLAAAVSLVLASAKLRDHTEDGDGAFGNAAIGGIARKTARRWATQADTSGFGVGFDTNVLTSTVDRQSEVERSLRPGDSVLLATEPTELATGAAFAHTATLADRPDNAAALSEAGTLFGRTAHLLDAVEDHAEDSANGAWNPLTATETSLDEARRLCDDAVHGVRMALSEADFNNAQLVHALLVHELEHAVRRTFGHAGHSADSSSPSGSITASSSKKTPYKGTPPKDGDGGCCWYPKFRVPPGKERNKLFGCLISTYMCCSCQFCCRDPHPNPWTGEPEGSGDCGDCDCCSGCDCDCGC